MSDMELHTYYSKTGLLKVSWGNRIDLDSVLRHFELLRVSSHYDRNLKVISSSEVEEIDIPLVRDNLIKIRNWRYRALQNYTSVRTALYGLSPVPATYVHYFSEFFDTEKSCIELFETERQAFEWLGLEYSKA
ncbi:hypothetical protein [Pelagicoccus albus]|uniref:SpoIIAA-like n=1 Tax=Pelagicoccus albus TaxID=415222 RepID=A0A7X1E9M9_9BACT|nr:hypothetical protein [Pelagicoccus albus]MBC2607594.1 hypothetical protein [Pelagicoccus albus]